MLSSYVLLPLKNKAFIIIHQVSVRINKLFSRYRMETKKDGRILTEMEKAATLKWSFEMQ